MSEYIPPANVTVWCCGCGGEFPATYALTKGMCDECVRERRRPAHQLAAENRRLREQMTQARRFAEQRDLDGVQRALIEPGQLGRLVDQAVAELRNTA